MFPGDQITDVMTDSAATEEFVWQILWSSGVVDVFDDDLLKVFDLKQLKLLCRFVVLVIIYNYKLELTNHSNLKIWLITE